MRRLLAALVALLLLASPGHAAPHEVQVTSSPSGAQVFDQTWTAGRSEGYLGTTPCTLRLEAQTSHDLWFVLPGWATIKGRVRVGESSVDVSLAPASLTAYARRWPWLVGLAVVVSIATVVWVRVRVRRLERQIDIARLDSPDLVGRVAGDYRVVRAIGEGAFAEVYQVEHIAYGDAFAMKVLRRDVCDDGVRRRFVREMAVGRDVRHPNMVPVHAFGQMEDGRPYLILELLEGETLEQRLRRGRFTVVDSLSVLLQAAEGLGFAHEHGVIHRDLKPENIMLEPDGHVRVMDFGIAKLVDHVRITVSNAVLGTPLYMSPEHLDARRIDERSDVYSLGVIGYEMLSGRPPFLGPDAFAVIAGHVRGEAPPLGPEVPSVLAAAIMRMMARDPAARPPSMQQAARSLRVAAAALVSAP